MSTQLVTIQSHVRSSFVGPNVVQGQRYALVQLNSPDDNVWTRSEDGRELGVVNYPYTGVNYEQEVAASNDLAHNVEWQFVQASDCGSDSYTIVDSSSRLVWTVSDIFDEHSQIVVQDYSQCDPAQLFWITISN